MRFNVINLGCRVNRVESDDIAARLTAQGWVWDSANPDAVVVNTCTVTGEAEKKTRKAVRHLLSSGKATTVVVTGCAAAIDPDEFEALDERVVVVAKPLVVHYLCSLESPYTEVIASDETEVPQNAFNGAPAQTLPLRIGKGFPARVGLKVQDGCDNACTYCIVHTARGKSHSRPIAACVDEAKRLEAAGVREAVLTGINLGSFCDGSAHLPALIEQIRAAAPAMRLRLSSIEPRDVDNAIIGLLASQDGMVCRHLHLPLQSGSSRVLAQMARPYNADEYLKLVCRIRRDVPQISFSTDIIVGFPGETEPDFQDTLALARECSFSKIHVFRYSRREGTPAAARDDQIDSHVIAHRARELSALGDRLRQAEANARVGTKERIAVESNGEGMSESYFPVRILDAEGGDLVWRTLTEWDKDGIFLT